MPIDASIALGVKPMQVKSQGEYLNELYNQQNAEQSNQLNMMKMQAMNREIADSEAVKNYFATTNRDDPNFAQGLSAISPKLGMDYDEYTAKIATQKVAAAEHAEGTTGKKLANTEASVKMAKNAQSEILDYPSEAMLTSWFEDAKRKGYYNPETLANIAKFNSIVLSIPAPIDPATGEPDFTARRQAITRLQLEAKDRLVKPTFNQGAWYYPPTAENPQGVTVGEPRADKPKPLTAKQDTDLQHNIGKDRRTAIDAIASFGDVKLATQKVRKIPTSALENVAGYTGYLPSLSDASKNADTDIKNLKGKVTALGKIAASAGGAIGTMAVQEWAIIRDMIADLDEKATSPDKFLEQMDLIDAQLAGAEERLRESYATTHQEDFVRYPTRFELPAAGAGAPPPPASAAKRNPKDEAAYQAYIKAHPTKAKAK